MDLRQTLSMSQKQLLVMTPKLQQAIKILQMPRLELNQYMVQQMLENPILELEETYEETEEIESQENIEDEETDEIESEDIESEIDLETGLPDDDDISTDDDLPELDITDDNFGDVDWGEYFDDHNPGSNEWEKPLDDELQTDIAVMEESLQDHLLWQLRMSSISDDDYEIGEAIIGDIDDDGYLTVDIKEIAESLGRDVADVERVLKFIQTFEPTGVGARDLKECLLIQIRQSGLEDTIAYRIVNEGYLEDLEANRYPQIAKELDIEIELVNEAASAIASLEPKPGRQFGPSMKSEYIIPDVVIEKIDGKYNVSMNDYGPRLRLKPYYRNMLVLGNSLDDETREYVQSKMQSALWLLESIEHRRRTILRVVESIFNVQRGFLEEGSKSLKPLTLKDIADRVGVHEATVSRAVRNRYVQTPRGVFELKHFFSSGVSTEDGGMASSVSVKEMIKTLIDKEDPKNPLSDSDIEQALSKEGIKIARRTIAKYRNELNIPPSSKRKQW